MADVIVGRGNLCGRGVYAGRDFREGEVVIKYRLKSITDSEYMQLSDDEKSFVHSHGGQKYLYSEPERYVNHSADPNTLQDFALQADVAFRDIKVSEMITTDARKDDY